MARWTANTADQVHIYARTHNLLHTTCSALRYAVQDLVDINRAVQPP